MSISNIPHEPLAALIAGIFILVMPRLLNYVIALYLIIIGIFGLMHGAWHPRSRAFRSWCDAKASELPRCDPDTF
jgi:hypothetical protein